MEFEIPEHLNRNAAEVRALGSPAFTGKILLSFMCQRIGLQDLSRKAVLDVGCGTRFASAILTHNIPIGRYIGVDVDREAIYWLRDNVNKPNMEFHCIDQENPMYNPGGRVSRADWSFATSVDLCCMFSVITHQLPPTALDLFREAAKCVSPEGYLFFTAHIHDGDEPYRELGAAATNLSSYSERELRSLLMRAGWQVESIHPRWPNPPDYPVPVPIADNLLCRKTDSPV